MKANTPTKLKRCLKTITIKKEYLSSKKTQMGAATVK